MKKKEAKKRSAEYRRQLNEIRDIRSKLHSAYSAFNTVTDPDMTDACIFEISALKSRYNHAVVNLKNMYQ